jgi:hypothetical protein
MKKHLLPATALAVVLALVLFAPAIAFSQTPTPKSGALLTITGTAGTTAVNVAVYDSQIHSGTVQSVPLGGGGTPACTSFDQIPTDAYVLQGGSPTGCDPGDAFEVTESNNGNAVHQLAGKTDLSGFHIETHYVCGGACAGGITGTGPVCNTSGTICANPDSGFVTITNNTGSAFSGTISLTGNSPIELAGDPFCPVGGVASDTATNLAAGASVTLALGSQGTTATPKNADTSNCGGFNAPQKLTLTAGHTFTFLMGGDDYQITPFNSNAGDTLTFLPVPVPAGFTESVPLFSPPSALVFNPGSTFPNQKCVPFADFSAPGNPVCPEFQLDCANGDGVCSDAGTFLYTAQVDYAIDPSSITNALIGGPAFLGVHANECPTSGFNFDIFLSYTSRPDPPLTRGGGSGNSCFVLTFDPTAPAIATGTTVSSFVGFQSPVVDGTLNVIKAGSVVPLKWQQFDSSGNPNPKLSWCQTGPSSADPTVCKDTSPLPPVGRPWVFLGLIQSSCSADAAPLNTATDTAISPNSSGFQNFLNGSYQFNWKTVKGSTGCVTVVLQYDGGLAVFPANFKYSAH